MKTSCYSRYAGPGSVRISIGKPYGLNLPSYLALAPSWSMLKMDFAGYEAAFARKLSRLDPEVVWKDLHDLAGEHEPVLLCYEKPPFHSTQWCHRRIVAKWFEKELKIVVDEFDWGNVGVFGEVAGLAPLPDGMTGDLFG